MKLMNTIAFRLIFLKIRTLLFQKEPDKVVLIFEKRSRTENISVLKIGLEIVSLKDLF